MANENINIYDISFYGQQVIKNFIKIERQFFKNWQQVFENFDQHVHQVIEGLVFDFNKSTLSQPEKINLYVEKLTSVQNIFTKVNETVISSNRYIKLNDLLEQYDRYAKKIPENIHLSTPLSKLEMIKNEPLNILFKKLLFVSLYHSKKFFRKISRNDKLNETVSSRANLNTLLKSTLVLPYMNIITKINEHLLSLFLMRIKGYHDTIEIIIETILKSMAENREKDGQISYFFRNDDALNYINEYNKNQLMPQKIITGLKKDLKKTKDELLQQFENEARFAGTIIFPAKKFCVKEIEKTFSLLNSNWEKRVKSWQKSMTAIEQNIILDVDLAVLSFQSIGNIFRVASNISGNIREKILPELHQTKLSIDNLRQKFLLHDIKSSDELRLSIFKENRLFLRSLRKQNLPQLLETIHHLKLTKNLENLSSQIQHIFESFRESHTFIQDSNFYTIPPIIRTTQLEIREILVLEILQILLENFNNHRNELSALINRVLVEVAEIDQIIESNWEASLELIETQEASLQESVDIATEGITRTISKLEDIEKQFSTISSGIESRLEEEVLFLLNKMILLENDENLFKLKIKIKKLKTIEQLRESLNLVFKAITTRSKLFWQYLIKIGNSGFLILQKLHVKSGLKTTPINSTNDLNNFYIELKQNTKKFPFVYRKLFRIEPISDDRMFLGREKEINYLSEAFNDWLTEKTGTVCIVSEKGAGKTSLINSMAVSHYQKLPIKIYSIEKTISKSEEITQLLNFLLEQRLPDLKTLENYVNNLTTRKIIILDNLHRIFIRKPDGFEGLKTLLLFMSKTQHKIHWICSFGEYGFNYLDKVMHISESFRTKLILDKIPDNVIKEIILKLHRVSGFQLVFEEPNQIKHNKKYLKLKTVDLRQQYLEDVYFEKLFEFANGNLTVAKLYWISSIHKFQEGRTIIRSGFDIDFSFLHALNDNEIFTLGLIAQHELMTIDEHSLLFKLPLKESEIFLNRMKEKGLLFYRDDGSFEINLFLYRPIIRMLKLKNFLH